MLTDLTFILIMRWLSPITARTEPTRYFNRRPELLARQMNSRGVVRNAWSAFITVLNDVYV
jgi:hypothetical protein